VNPLNIIKINILVMENKKHTITIKETLQMGNWHSQIHVNNLNDLIEYLKDKGIISIDIENYPPYDNSSHTIKSDLLIDNISDKLFNSLIQKQQFTPFIVPRRTSPPQTIVKKNIMNIRRSFSEQVLLNTPKTLFPEKLKQDCIDEEVFLTVRNKYLDFYHQGGRLFKFEKKGFQTHIKYAAVINKSKNDYLTQNELSSYKLANNFIKSYSRIKENCSNYSGVEAFGVSQLYHKYSYLSNSNIVVLDIEVSFQSLSNKKKQDRIDILLYNKETQELQFVEAKHYSNKEIRSKTKPKVIKQLEKYERQIANKEQSIIKAYSDYIKIINDIFNRNILPLPIKNINPKVTLFVFGFDDDQKKRGLKTITNKLKSQNFKIKFYSVGETKGIKITSLWNAKEL
jgi:hypothetical protein